MEVPFQEFANFSNFPLTWASLSHIRRHKAFFAAEHTNSQHPSQWPHWCTGAAENLKSSKPITFLSLLREAASCQTGSMSWTSVTHWINSSATIIGQLCEEHRAEPCHHKSHGVSFFLSNSRATKMSGVPWHTITSGLMDFGLFLPFLRKEGINIRGARHPPLQQWLPSEQALSHVEGSQGTRRCWHKFSSLSFLKWVRSSSICATSGLSGVQIVAF